MATARPVQLLDALVVAQIRAPETRRMTVEYGVATESVGTGRATCRACGQHIAKGERTLRFPWSFGSRGSYTAVDMTIHAEPCQG